MSELPDFLKTRPRATGRKTPLSESSALRRHRVRTPQQCIDDRAKIENIHRLIAATEQEYREAIAEIDRLDNEGRVWLVVDFIHKTALATLDLGASMTQATGLKSSEAIGKLAKGTRTVSDFVTQGAAVLEGDKTGADFARTAAERGLSHLSPDTARGAFTKGTADIALKGKDNLGRIADAQGTPSEAARTGEGATDLVGGLIQRTADTVNAAEKETGNAAGSPTAKKVSALAAIARSMAAYGRELEGVFDRRLDISSSLQSQRTMRRMAMERLISLYRRQAADLKREMEGC